MPVEWSGLGPDLMLSVDRALAAPLRSQLEDQLREAIRHGRVRAGERLPSSRALARDLGLSRGLVQDCYAQLLAEGYLTARTGSATVVAPGAEPPRPSPARAGPARALVADFAHGLPDLGSFPRADWAHALREACRTAPTAAFGYDDPRGNPRLREVLAAYLRRVRGAAADPECIVDLRRLRAGTRSRARRAQGRRPAPGRLRGSRLRRHRAGRGPPGGAGAGARPGRRRRHRYRCADGVRVRAVVLTPAHQWPTGVVLAPRRRTALVAWAAERDAIIIEDDYDAEFRYDREAVGALQGVAANRVISLGTVSKSLAPSVRLGWMLCPPHLVAAIAARKHDSDRGCPGLDQLALAILLESGRYDRHLRRMRAQYAQRRDVLAEALARHAPRVELTGLAAGFHAVAHLPAGVSEAGVIAAARERAVALYGMSAYRSTGSAEPPQLILGFGNTAERAIQAGLAAVGDLLDGRSGASRSPTVAGDDSLTQHTRA